MGSSKISAMLFICMIFMSMCLLPPTYADQCPCTPPYQRPSPPGGAPHPPHHHPHPPKVLPPIVFPPPVVSPPITHPPGISPPITRPPPGILPPIVNPPGIIPPITRPPGIIPPIINPPGIFPPITNPPGDALKLGLCLDVLGGLVHIGIGNPVEHICCPVLQGLLELEAAICLCTTIRLKLLNLNIFLPLALSVLATCGLTPPPGVCANVLNGPVGAVIGTPPDPHCCMVLGGLLDLEAAVCLCTALKANILGININIPIALSLLINTCGKTLPSDFICA
uniref:Bifunctional inhibitor/plant lipid transfer protein/seed storage helical domain-containing protein n=1 Tax=Solanum lycopersicum TaxID=4081 RepID=A0A3Q7HUZ3_SOLLC